MDMMSGYWQVLIKEEDKPKTAFGNSFIGFWEFNVMPFGVTNAPATYQRLMDEMLGPLRFHCSVDYIDDLLTYSSTFKEHLHHLQLVFNRMKEFNITAKITKCHFCPSQMSFLGYIFDQQGVHPDPNKVKAIENLPIPENITQLRQFLGLTSYYRKFIKEYANTAAPLTDLLRQSTPFLWTTATDWAFNKLKQSLLAHPILQLPDLSKEFTIITDASGIAISAILTQHFEKKEVVIEYASRVLSPSERNYSATQREALAVFWGINQFKQYLTPGAFTIQTDHHSLRWLMSMKNPQGILARWIMELQTFGDFKIQYRPGSSNTNADTLSQLITTETINLLTVELFPEDDMSRLQLADTFCKSIIDYLKDNNLPEDKKQAKITMQIADNCVIQDNTLWYHSNLNDTGKVLILPETRKERVLQACHDHLTWVYTGLLKKSDLDTIGPRCTQK